jgi:DNA transformation protein
MFGGWAFYKNGAIFAIIADGELYFKTDAESRPDFERRGSRPFVYNKGKVKSTTMSYWILPAEIAEDAASLERWIERSARISGRKKR